MYGIYAAAGKGWMELADYLRKKVSLLVILYERRALKQLLKKNSCLGKCLVVSGGVILNCF